MALMTPDAMNGVQSLRPTAPNIPLSRLIDFAIQRTYHELQVLADLLPRKSDMERKIAIVQFADTTRKTFIRLLALVKWAGSASKVEKCANIVNFLDKQSMLYTETADTLAKMARESLVQARLASFHIPAAVEVLTLGTYSRLPTCIREKIVPPDPITPSEKKATLLRLNQIIQQRLVTSALPSQMRNLKIENGRVTFHVNFEFELCLTVMGDSANIPWKVLNVSILVMDRETGDGRDLVHPFQVRYIQDLIQTRLFENSRPLFDAYNVLHSFCLSLQLEVLNAQTHRLSRERLADFIRIEEYLAGKRLSIVYWREMTNSSSLGSSDRNTQSAGMRLVIEINSSDPVKPLQILHIPELGEKESLVANDSIKSDHLSIEKLFIHTTHERAKQSLNRLEILLSELKMGDVNLSGCPPVLELAFLTPCMPSEKLLISVDTLTGVYLAHIPQFEDCPLVDKFPVVIKDTNRLILWIRELRIWVTKQRCKKTVEFLPVMIHESLPFSSLKPDPVVSSSSPKIFLHFTKHHNYYLMVVFEETPESCEITMKYYLMSVENVSFDGIQTQNSQMDQIESAKSFLRVNTLLGLDTNCLLKGKSRSSSSGLSFSDNFGKRKIKSSEETDSKKLKNCGFYIPDLAYLISFCEEKLAYGSLSSELQKRQICHQIRVGNEPSNSHVVDIVQFPPRAFGTCRLQKDLLKSNIRLQGKGNKIWTVSLCFCNCPIQTLSSKENGVRKTVYLMYDFANGTRAHVVQMVEELLEDLAAIEKLYGVVYDFGKVASSFTPLIDIKSFTYKKLFLNYGPEKAYTVAIHWKSLEKRFQLNFGLTGVTGSNSNPHVLVATQLQNEFNQHRSISTLVQTLTTTFPPLLSILNLSSITLLGVINSRPQVPVQTFCVIPQTSTHIRLLYRNTYCVDIVIQPDELVAVRDGAYCLFDKLKVLEELTPIQGLKAFLNRFVDKNAPILRRLSQNEDDHPPSPISHMETSVEQYLFSSSQMKTSSPMGANISDGVSRVHPVSVGASLGSNPNTPASPHTSTIMGQVGYGASPSGFPMAASPSTHGSSMGHPHSLPAPSPSISQSNQMSEHQSPAMFNVNSPANPMHAPSPSSFLPTPSPQPASSSHMQSPAPNYMSQTPHSPFHPSAMSNIHSPAAGGGWPGSPSIPRPSPSRPMGSVQSPGSCGQPLNIGQSPQTPTSIHPSAAGLHGVPFQSSARILPQRSWAAAIPTILTPQGFDAMCRPSPLQEIPPHMFIGNSVIQSLSQLDRFLGCVSMRRHLLHSLQRTQEDSFQMLPANPNEPMVIQFKNESMQFRITPHPQTMQSLHLKIMPTSDQFKNQWSPEEFEIIERFFEAKVVSAPYKPNAFMSFTRILNAPYDVLKDCIQLMKLELYPEKNMNVHLQWHLTIPPSSPVILGNPGMSAVLVFKSNTLFFYLQFSRHSPHGVEIQSTVVPFLYDMANRTLKLPQPKDSPPFLPNTFLGMVNSILQRFYEYPQGGCSIILAIRKIMETINQEMPQ